MFTFHKLIEQNNERGKRNVTGVPQCALFTMDTERENVVLSQLYPGRGFSTCPYKDGTRQTKFYISLCGRSHKRCNKQ